MGRALAQCVEIFEVNSGSRIHRFSQLDKLPGQRWLGGSALSFVRARREVHGVWEQWGDREGGWFVLYGHGARDIYQSRQRHGPERDSVCFLLQLGRSPICIFE